MLCLEWTLRSHGCLLDMVALGKIFLWYPHVLANMFALEISSWAPTPVGIFALVLAWCWGVAVIAKLFCCSFQSSSFLLEQVASQL